MPIRFRNTLTSKKEVLRPRQGKRLDVFVCGPTVYDHSHVGHARTFTVFDGIISYLRWRGYKVRYLVNITDIDDKIINRANESGKDPLRLSKEFTGSYLDDMKRLRIDSVTYYEPASAHIPEITKQISTLMKKGFAYASGGSVYFLVAKFKEYGKLSKQNRSKLRTAVRIKDDPNKRDPLDFVLWKAQKPGEPFWPSPWGPGRPGWHIEDTAISESFFGSQYDIHGGAIELTFPHHESEIAQQEAASGEKPFVRLWLHSGLLNIGGEKMSKSLKNFVTIREMLDKHSAESFRILVFRTHYRAPVHYTDDLLDETKRALERLNSMRERLKSVSITRGKTFFAKRLLAAFIRHLDDDFDTPRFLAALFTTSSAINKSIDQNKLSQKEALEILKVLETVDKILKIFPKTAKRETEIPARIIELAQKREVFRKSKNWAEADRIRKEIEDAGFSLQDSATGPLVEKQ